MSNANPLSMWYYVFDPLMTLEFHFQLMPNTGGFVLCGTFKRFQDRLCTEAGTEGLKPDTQKHDTEVR